LEVIQKDDFFKAFWLRKYSDSTLMSCRLYFTPYEIIITGDLCPVSNGLVVVGYDMEWFSGNLAPYYLASKFLKKEWVTKAAMNMVREYIRTAECELEAEIDQLKGEYDDDDWQKDQLPDRFQRKLWKIGNKTIEGNLIDALKMLLYDEDHFGSPERLYDAIPAYKNSPNAPYWTAYYDSEFLMGGYDYPEGKLGWLYAIQRRFSELIKELD